MGRTLPADNGFYLSHAKSLVRNPRQKCNPNAVRGRQTASAKSKINAGTRIIFMRLNNRTIRSILVLVAVTFSIGAFGAAQGNAQILKEVLDRMDKNYKTLQTVRSDITMVKANNQLDTKDTTSGSVAFISKNYKKKLYARIDWTKPLEESMVVIGDRYQLYRPSLKQAIIGSTKQTKTSGAAGGALAFMSMSKAEIQTNYDVKYVGQEGVSGSVQTWHIFMTPRTPTSYKSADLWVDSDGMPRQAMITENNGDTTTIVLAKIKKNDEVKTSEFSLDVPKGTKIING